MRRRCADSRAAFEIGAAERLGRVADNAAARAVAAIAGALRGDEHQHAVGIAMHQSGHGRMLVFSQRIFHHRLERYHFGRCGNDLLTYWTVRVFWIDQAGKVGRNVDSKQAIRRQRFALRLSEVDE